VLQCVATHSVCVYVAKRARAVARAMPIEKGREYVCAEVDERVCCSVLQHAQYVCVMRRGHMQESKGYSKSDVC